MVTLVALHWMTREQLKKGLEAFEQNSERAKTAKGFVSRLVLRSRSDPNKYTTVTTWETWEDYERFQNDPNRAVAHRDPKAPPLFVKLERDVYDVVSDVKPVRSRKSSK